MDQAVDRRDGVVGLKFVWGKRSKARIVMDNGSSIDEQTTMAIQNL